MHFLYPNFDRKSLLALVAVACILLGGCKRVSPGSSRGVNPAPGVTQLSLRLSLTPIERREMIIESMRKRVMGRRQSLEAITRVVEDDAPIVAQAVRQPAARAALGRIARDNGVSLARAADDWAHVQEADLLLESGGNPDSISSSNAVGVAQWLAGGAKAHGMNVDGPTSIELTRQINPLKLRIAWDEYLSGPHADPHAPGAPSISASDAAAELPRLRAQLNSLRAKRKLADQRYDPNIAIPAQTLYLLHLYRKFPSIDWLFQAYHGGEAGVTRTLKKYLGHAWPGSAAAAIRPTKPRNPLTFEQVYLTTTPRSAPAAFSYLYGRGDDHRYYWWKILAAERAIAIYRKSHEEFEKEWASLLPARSKEAVWYPKGPEIAFDSSADLQSATRDGVLVAVAERHGYVLRQAPLDHGHSAVYAALRPAAAGLLEMVAQAYRAAGGRPPLKVGDMALTNDYLKLAAAQPDRVSTSSQSWPPDPIDTNPPGGGPPPSFDYHVTGLAFDLVRPDDKPTRIRLEYALGYFSDRGILWWTTEKSKPGRPYHVVPNPQYVRDLANIANGGRLPALPGL